MQFECLCVRGMPALMLRGGLQVKSAPSCRSRAKPGFTGEGVRGYLLSHRLQHSHAGLLRAAGTLELLLEEADKDVGEEPAITPWLSLRPRMRPESTTIDGTAATQQ